MQDLDRKNYLVVHQLSDRQVADLVELYQQAWWSRGREPADVGRMLAHSDGVVGLVDPGTDTLVGFARFLTDRVYKAVIFDVMVLDSLRGAGAGQQVMDALMAHPRMSGVAHVELYCLPEMVPFYQRWGFTDELGELRYMRIIPVAD